MSRFVVTPLLLAGLSLLHRQPRADSRGTFSRLFCADELALAGWKGPVVQINHSKTLNRGSVRGLHFQRPPHAEIKLVTCIRGEIWDVAVDLRAGSPTFLHWHAQALSAANNAALLIPAGFAHGFQALSDDAEVLYCHSAPYIAEAEDGLNPTDPQLAIAWPVPITEISPRDAAFLPLSAGFKGVAL